MQNKSELPPLAHQCGHLVIWIAKLSSFAVSRTAAQSWPFSFSPAPFKTGESTVGPWLEFSKSGGLFFCTRGINNVQFFILQCFFGKTTNLHIICFQSIPTKPSLWPLKLSVVLDWNSRNPYGLFSCTSGIMLSSACNFSCCNVFWEKIGKKNNLHIICFQSILAYDRPNLPYDHSN